MDVDRLRKLAGALTDATRVRILLLLEGRRWSVKAIAQALGCSTGNASHHVQVLANAGLVGVRKKGRYRLVERNEDAWKKIRHAFGPSADSG